MTLFDNLDEGGIELLSHGGSAVLHRSALEPARADELFRLLTSEIPWQRQTIRMFGREVLQPRLIAWMGDPGRNYCYSGNVHEPIAWTAPVLELRDLSEKHAGVAYNSVLLNLYRDGSDGIAWHSDDEPELGPHPTIASVSLGAERRFDLRHKATGETIKAFLPHGSVLIMTGDTQREWAHQIPKSRNVRSPRINLTFRWIEPDGR